MERQFKSIPQFVKSVEGRTVTGICAVFGNIDLGRDRIWPGAFAKTISEGRGRFKHLWNHGQDGWDYFVTPPIAAIRSLREVGREELPESVTAFAPEASGGLEVTREYLDTERGNEVLKAIEAGAGLEMSFGYDPIKWDYQTINQGTIDEKRVRELREVRLWDTSDVNWGMNPATSADGKAIERISALVSRVEEFAQQFRSGKKDFAGHLLKLRRLLAELELEEEQQQQTEQPGEGKSRADAGFDWRASLTQSIGQLRELEISI